MLFNSLIFAFFLPTVFFIYWFVVNKNVKIQNVFLIVASYFFYGWWDWRFLGLIFFSSITDFFIGKKLHQQEKQLNRNLLMTFSLFTNLGVLFYFKYCNFFIENFVSLFSSLGISTNVTSLNIILPIGISFYTFQTLSYTIDIYKKQGKPTDDVVSFLAFVSFFPQLVAGPIERASNLVPQFLKPRRFKYEDGAEGARLILWGFLKKVVIADNCAYFVNNIFDNYADQTGSTLVLGLVLFAFQVYGDFSGYSDIAVGTARLFGIKLMDNFNFPYFSTSITEFWRRWHISLSTWLRDYLYTPMVMELRGWGMKGIIFSTICSFTIIGFWHGPNWVYIIFGLCHGLVLSYEILNSKRRKRWKKSMNKKVHFLLSLILTLTFYLFTLILFRSVSVTDALSYTENIFSKSLFTIPAIIAPKYRMIYTLILILAFIITEWFRKDKKQVLDVVKLSSTKRWAIYAVVIGVIIVFGRFNNNDFIYFQF